MAKTLTNEPAVKLLLNLKKEYLKIKANEMGLSAEGNKKDLAIRIAKEEEQVTAHYWDIISGRKK